MYEPFPGNYVWNLSVNICLSMGGAIGEIGKANAKVREIATQGADKGTAAFFDAWVAMADQLLELGREDEAAGHKASAAEKYRRAIAYYMTAERMQNRDYGPRKAAYATMLETVTRFLDTSSLGASRVEVPYEGGGLPAYFVPGRDPKAPCVIMCNGLDSTKEMILLTIMAEFQDRGIACLMVDQPGVGEPLRLHDLKAVVDSERWAGAAVDYLETRPDVAPDRIGIMGWSLGGYFAPRAAAFDKRLKLCVAWGANPDWGELQRRRLAREGANPVPHYWDHVMWVWGQPDVETFLRFADQVKLDGITEQITVPFLIVHGASDRQIPLEFAERCYAEAVNSPKRQLRIFTEREGGVHHCAADNVEPSRSFIADWVAETFAEFGGKPCQGSEAPVAIQAHERTL